jgi:hypothetical protein
MSEGALPSYNSSCTLRFGTIGMKLEMDPFTERHWKRLEEFRIQIGREATKNLTKILENFRSPMRGEQDD